MILEESRVLDALFCPVDSGDWSLSRHSGAGDL